MGCYLTPGIPSGEGGGNYKFPAARMNSGRNRTIVFKTPGSPSGEGGGNYKFSAVRMNSDRNRMIVFK